MLYKWFVIFYIVICIAIAFIILIMSIVHDRTDKLEFRISLPISGCLFAVFFWPLFIFGVDGIVVKQYFDFKKYDKNIDRLKELEDFHISDKIIHTACDILTYTKHQPKDIVSTLSNKIRFIWYNKYNAYLEMTIDDDQITYEIVMNTNLLRDRFSRLSPEEIENMSSSDFAKIYSKFSYSGVINDPRNFNQINMIIEDFLKKRYSYYA